MRALVQQGNAIVEYAVLLSLMKRIIYDVESVASLDTPDDDIYDNGSTQRKLLPTQESIRKTIERAALTVQC